MNNDEINLSELLGAIIEPSVQVLTLYIPDRDKDGRRVKNLNRWIEEAKEVLTAIGGGSTSMPPADGSWKNPESGKVVRENTTIIYTYIDPDEFEKNLDALRDFLHRFGRETNQGEVVLEFDGRLYRIREYDEE